MRFVIGLGMFMAAVSCMSAQRRAAVVVAPPSPPALGGNFATHGSSHPLGGVAYPTFPAAQPAARRTKASVRTGGAGRYYGPVYYVPNAYDTYADGPGAPEAPPEPEYAPPPPSVYGPDRRSSFQSPREPASMPGDPIGVPENYYLIAYKNFSIQTALAYWVEDRTLHYVTTQNTHNQASLDLIDLDRTTKLNADHAVPFAIAAR